MRNIAIIIVLFSISNLYGQKVYSLQKNKYKTALSYIKKTMPVNSTVCVSNYMIDLGIYIVNELDSFPDLKNELQILDDKKMYQKGYSDFYNEDLAKIFSKPTKAKAIVFFSKMEEKILRADLIICNRIVTKSIDFNSAICLGRGNTFSYVFFFNQDGTLREAFFYEMIYEAVGPVFNFE